jgi:hypothetical protein
MVGFAAMPWMNSSVRSGVSGMATGVDLYLKAGRTPFDVKSVSLRPENHFELHLNTGRICCA